MKKLLILISLLLCTLSGCTSSENMKTNKQERYSSSSITSGFDTVMTLIGYADSEEQFDQYFNYMSQRFYQLHQYYDIYNNYEGITNIKTVNDHAGDLDYAIVENGEVVGSKIIVPDEIIDLIILVKEYNELLDGKVDITQGNLLSIWHKYRDEASINGIGPVPILEDLNEAFNADSFDNIFINEETNEVFIKDPNVSFDLGGVAKGYSAALVSEELTEMGLENGIVNAGGNNIALGQKPEGYFVTQLENPNGEELDLGLYMMPNHSVVSSSDRYRRYIDTNGDSHHHLIDFNTLYPANYHRQVSIITADNEIADILSTALFTMSFEEGYKIYEEFNNFEAIWVMETENAIEHPNGIYLNDLYIIYTDGLKDQLIYFNK